MLTSLHFAIIFIILTIITGSSVYVAGVYNVSFSQDDIERTLQKYNETANSCDLGDKDYLIKNKIFSATKEYDLNHNSTKARELLENIRQDLIDCPLKKEFALFGITEDNFFQTLNVIAFIIFGILGALGIQRYRKSDKHKKA